MINKESLGYLLNNCSLAIARRLTNNFKEAGYSITVDQWRILNTLWHLDGISQAHLAKAINKDKASITRTLALMHDQEWITKDSKEEDSRVNLIYLSLSGKKLKEPLTQIAKRTIREALKDFSDEEKENIKIYLQRIYKNLT